MLTYEQAPYYDQHERYYSQQLSYHHQQLENEYWSMAGAQTPGVLPQAEGGHQGPGAHPAQVQGHSLDENVPQGLYEGQTTWGTFPGPGFGQGQGGFQGSAGTGAYPGAPHFGLQNGGLYPREQFAQPPLGYAQGTAVSQAWDYPSGTPNPVPGDLVAQEYALHTGQEVAPHPGQGYAHHLRQGHASHPGQVVAPRPGQGYAPDPAQSGFSQGLPQAQCPLEQYMGQFPSRLDFNADKLTSRPETTIAVTLTLRNAPVGIERVHLPRLLLAGARLYAKNPEERPLQTLEMETMLVRADDVKDLNAKIQTLNRAANGGDRGAPAAEICYRCVERERKRANRCKSKSEAAADWESFIPERATILTKPEYSDWEHDRDPHGQRTRLLRMPVRIPCYCRHHNTTKGFCLVFTLKNHEGNVVAQAISEPVFVTDNHKGRSADITKRRTEDDEAGSSRGRRR
ncbi:hypothetical protein IWZ03DRAFT_205361 [Phyllosticta citriasiana]|uniref:SPT23/MGA2-like DNA-binding domain-containing protein n=1 Tax=Phyllosticta citriasiana TaxID=595635 RepID=A0ABR1KIF2_9PEZI